MLVVSLSLAAVMRDLSRSVWVYKLSWVYKLCLGSQTYRVQRFSRKVGGGDTTQPIYIYIYIQTVTDSIYTYHPLPSMVFPPSSAPSPGLSATSVTGIEPVGGTIFLTVLVFGGCDLIATAT